MNILSLLKYLLVVGGLAMLTGAGLLYQNAQHFLYQAYKTQGQVVAFEQNTLGGSVSYRPVVSYQDANGNAHQFTSSVGDNPPAYLIGENVELLYVPGNKPNAKLNHFYALWGNVVLSVSFGAVFFLAGLAITAYLFFKSRNLEYLKRHGTPVNAQFIAVEMDEKLEINGRHPFRIQAMWQDPNTKEVFHFNSDNIWFDPSLYTKEKLTVLIDSENPRKYYMDVSFLPKKLV